MQSQNYSESISIEQIDLQEYWLVLKRRWLPLSAICLTFTSLGLIAGLLLPENYETSGKLLFKRNPTSTLVDVGQGAGELDTVSRSNPLATQAELVKSFPVLQETIKILDLKDKDGEPVKPQLLEKYITVRPLKETDIILVSYSSPNPKFAADLVNQVMKSYLDKNMDTNRAQAVAAGQFIEEELPNRELAVEQAEQALEDFKNKNNLTSLQQEADSTVTSIKSLDGQIDQAKAQLVNLEKQMEEIRLQINMPKQQAIELSSLSQSSGVQAGFTELQNLETRLVVERARLTENHPLIVSLERQKADLNDLLQKRIEEVVGVNKQFIDTQSEVQIDQLTQSLIESLVNLQVTRAGIVKQVETLSQIRDKYIQRSKVFPRLEKQQRQLERQLSAAQTIYNTLLTNLQEIRVTENKNLGNAQIIEEALVPEKPISNLKRQLLLFVGSSLLGILVGIGAAFLIDLMDKSVKTLREAEKVFGYTLLGLIPQFEIEIAEGKEAPDKGRFLALPKAMSKVLGRGQTARSTTNGNEELTKTSEGEASNPISPRIITLESPEFLIYDSYQMLQANLRFMKSDKQLQTIVITSCVRGEGTSEVCANLALAMAQAGKKVLLVDANLRKPSQHHLWGLLNSVGLSYVIIGEAELESAIKPIRKNLSVLTAGVVPPSPIALLDSERMASLMAIFSQDYDYVIFDTPSLAGTADSLAATADAGVLGKMADGLLLVVQPGVVDLDSATMAKSLLLRFGVNILGMVANGVDVQNIPDISVVRKDETKPESKEPELSSFWDI